MIRGARVIVGTCVDVQSGENVLIIADRYDNPVIPPMVEAVLEKGAEPSVCIMTPRTGHGLNPPEPIVEAMLASNVIFGMATDYSISHSPARVAASAAGARYLNLVGYTPEMLSSGGLFTDFIKMAPSVKRIGQLFGEAKRATVIAQTGEEIAFDVSGRRGNGSSCLARNPGEASFPPAMQVNTTPIEGQAEGTIILDGSIPMKGLGVLSAPIELTIRKGRIVKMSGGREADLLDAYLGASGDPNDYMISEIGLGLNPKLRKLTGGLLEDEGGYGVVHYGIGENLTLGGKLKSSLHLDVMVRNATLILDETVVVDKGRMVLPDWIEADDGQRG